MSFKDISKLELWWPFCSAEQIHSCNLFRGHHVNVPYFSILFYYANNSDMTPRISFITIYDHLF